MKGAKLFLIVFMFLWCSGYAQCFHFTVQITNPSCPGCCDGSAAVISLSGGCKPYTYSWFAGQTTSSISNLCSGNYQVVISDSGNCCKDSSAFCCLDCPPTGMRSLALKSLPILRIESGALLVESSEQVMELELTNLSGKIVLRRSFYGRSIIDIGTISGICLAKITDKEGNILIMEKIFIPPQ